MEQISSDKILSLWIYFYCILYYFNVVSYNPIILIAISMFFQIFSIIYVIYYSNFSIETIKIISFIIVALFFKLFIVYLLYEKILINITSIDAIFTITFFIVYYIYITLLNETLYSIYFDLLNHYIDSKDGRISSLHYYYKLLV